METLLEDFTQKLIIEIIIGYTSPLQCDAYGAVNVNGVCVMPNDTKP